MSRLSVCIVGLLIGATSLVYTAAAQHVVGQKGRLFKPGVMTVKAGDVVGFENNDNVTHHIYSSTKGQEFNLETMKIGEQSPYAFPKKGRVEVRCGLHPGMRLIVNVE